MMELNFQNVRNALIEIAQQEGLEIYSVFAGRFGLSTQHGDMSDISRLLGEVSRFEHEHNRPLLSVLIFREEYNRPGGGFYDLAEGLDVYNGSSDEMQRLTYSVEESKRVYAYWHDIPVKPTLAPDQLDELKQLNQDYADATPEQKPRVVKRVERGSIGKLVKELNEYKCQVCEVFGLNPIGFEKRSSEETYVEAHHVIPVSTLEKGVLSARNIITVCANHHRQMHYGNADVIWDQTTDKFFVFEIDGERIEIAKVDLGDE